MDDPWANIRTRPRREPGSKPVRAARSVERWIRDAALRELTAIGADDPAAMLDVPKPASKRRGVPKRVRDRIGDRDGWTCRICGGPVDRDHKWVPGIDKVLRGEARDVVLTRPDQAAQWAAGEPRRAAAVLDALRRLYVDALKGCPEAAHGGCGHGVVLPAHVMDGLEELDEAWRTRNHAHPSAEHLVPACAGGGHDEDNLALVHFGCNIRAANATDFDGDAPNRAVIKAMRTYRQDESAAARRDEAVG